MTLDELRAVLRYNKRTGDFTWRVNRGRNAKIGWVAGSPEKRYWAVTVFQRRYRAHRLAWFYVTGAWPKEDVDHENGNRRDNRWRNLREGSRSFNMENVRQAHRDNKSGFLGVSSAPAGKWKAEITTRGLKRHLGVFKTPKLAHRAYLKAKRELHEGCTL